MRWILFSLLALTLALAQGFLLESDLVQAFELAPGQEAQGVLRLRNTSSEALVVELSLADYREREGFLPLGTAPRSLGPEGLTLGAGQVSLGPGEVREVSFRVRAPQGYSGTRYAAILLAPGRLAPQGGEGGPGVQAGLRVVQRYGVLVLVSHGGEPSLAFTGARVEEGRLVVEAVNGGERYYRPQVRYQVVGPSGVAASGELGSLLFLPGEPKRLWVPLPALAPGEYQLVILLDDGVKAYAARTRLSLR